MPFFQTWKAKTALRGKFVNKCENVLSGWEIPCIWRFVGMVFFMFLGGPRSRAFHGREGPFTPKGGLLTLVHARSRYMVFIYCLSFALELCLCPNFLRKSTAFLTFSIDMK